MGCTVQRLRVCRAGQPAATPTPAPLLQIVLTVNFSSRTTSMDIQRNLEANVEKRTKDTYGPPMGKRLLVFMDDMNMPKVAARPGVLSVLAQVWGPVRGCSLGACRGRLGPPLHWRCG